MNIGKYTLRSVKYFIKLAILLGLLFTFMVLSGTSGFESEGGIGGFFATLFATTKGKLFVAALVVWCAIYPSVEFVKRHSNFDMHKRKEAIVKALNAGGMTLSKEDDHSMTFHGHLPRRIWWLDEDAVTITNNPSGGFDIEGPRRFVMEAEHRIPTYIENE